MKGFIIGFTLFMALIAGLSAALFGWASLFIVPPILLAIWVLRDYRVGAVFVAIALPFISSRLLPHAAGLNPINYALAAATLILIISRLFKIDSLIGPPKILLICLILPLFVGLALSFPHLAEGARNFANKENMDSIFDKTNYTKLYLIRPLSFVVLSLLLANAVHDSKKPERFVLMLAFAALAPVAAIIWLVLALGIDLGTLQSHRGYLSSLGLHSNEFGKLLAFAFGPLLYVSFATHGYKRIFYTLATIFVVIGILLTFTRAAYIAVVLVLVIFLIQRKRIGTVIAMALLVPSALLLAPDAFMDRIATGVDESSLEGAQAGSLKDKLTAGRIGGYQLMLPEVKRSPIIGRGTGATAWSGPVSRGQYEAANPHNMYLEATLDLGLFGLALTIYFYRRLLDAMNRLSRRPEFSEEMKAFFKGSATGLIGILVLSMSGGHWYPHPEQAIMWISFGICFAYWPWVEAQRTKERNAKVEQLASAAQKSGNLHTATGG